MALALLKQFELILKLAGLYLGSSSSWCVLVHLSIRKRIVDSH